MTSPENTTNRDPAEHLIGLIGAGPNGYIETMEHAGGEQMRTATVLPTQLLGSTRADFEALGFTFGEEIDGDPLFQEAALPAGWHRDSAGHPQGLWTDIKDERGLTRVAVFYKAAFYDRNSHMSIVNVGNGLATDFVYGKVNNVPWDLLTDTERADYLTGLERNLEEIDGWIERHPGEKFAQEAAERRPTIVAELERRQGRSR